MNDFSTRIIFSTIFKYKKQLIICLVASFLVGAFVSSPMVMKPKYKSQAVIYPSNIVPYGIETVAEQALQILQSQEIKDEVIKTYDLYKHFGVSKESPTAKTDVLGIYDDNVTIEKTMYESVKIVVMDEDAEIAKKMIDKIIDIYNSKIRHLHQAKYLEVMEINRKEMIFRKRELDSVENRLLELRTKYNILNVEIQTKEAYKAYYKALSGGSPKLITESKRMIDNLERLGGEFSSLSVVIGTVRSVYMNAKYAYEGDLKNVQKFLTYSNVVTEPYKADKKAYPIRWLVTLIFVLSGLTISILGIIILELQPFKNIID